MIYVFVLIMIMMMMIPGDWISVVFHQIMIIMIMMAIPFLRYSIYSSFIVCVSLLESPDILTLIINFEQN